MKPLTQIFDEYADLVRAGSAAEDGGCFQIRLDAGKGVMTANAALGSSLLSSQQSVWTLLSAWSTHLPITPSNPPRAAAPPVGMVAWDSNGLDLFTMALTERVSL